MVIPRYHDILDLLRKGLTIEAREKILELREAALRLQEENLALKAELRQFQGEAELCGQMFYEKGVYWQRTPTEDGTNLAEPYCQVCHDRDKKPVRLQ